MLPDAVSTFERGAPAGWSGWRPAAIGFAMLAAAAFAITGREWLQMITIWWNFDPYSHILIIPPIIGWLVWLRRDDLVHEQPQAWWPGLVLLAAALLLWAGGRAYGVNLLAHAGAVATVIALTLAMFGPRIGAILALPLSYAIFLVPFGDEIIPPLQFVTAEMAVALTRLAGVPAAVDGFYIDTPAGLFIVAEACAGVQFLVAMVALGILACFTAFESWKRRALFLAACVVVPIIANGIRAWATIYIAQFVGAEAAGSFDHIVYGWIFFGIVIAILLGGAWRYFEREPEDAGWSRAELDDSTLLRRLERHSIPAAGAVIGIAALFAAFTALAFAVPSV